MMKCMFNVLILVLLFVGCTLVRPIEKISTPLSIRGENVTSIDSIRLKIVDAIDSKSKFKLDIASLEKRIKEALSSSGIAHRENSTNFLELDVNRFVIVGDGLIFCQSVIELTARAKIKENVLNPKRFSASKNGLFCVFGNATEKMKEPTKEALEEVLEEMMNWAAKQ